MLKSPFNYTGSKFGLIEIIAQHLPDAHLSGRQVLWDLCCGGGSVFVNLHDRFEHIVANDIIKPLMFFYNFLKKTQWEEVIRRIEERNIPKDSQEQYLALRERFNQHSMAGGGNFLDFFILVSSCTNNMMRFNKQFKFNQTWGKRNFNASTAARLKAYHDVLYGNNKISLHCLSFEKCEPLIKENHFVYVDPPYPSGLVEAGYNAYWSEALELSLYDFLDRLNDRKVAFMLSNVAEHKGKANPFVNRWKKYNVINIDYSYNKVSRKGPAATQEVIVMNY